MKSDRQTRVKSQLAALPVLPADMQQQLVNNENSPFQKYTHQLKVSHLGYTVYGRDELSIQIADT